MSKEIEERQPGETPLVPVYPFRPPGTPIVLYEGPVAGFADSERQGRIELSCEARKGLRWRVDLRHDDHRLDIGQAQLSFRRNGQDWIVEAHERSSGEGWINMATYAQPNAHLRRVIVHWMNLPSIVGPIALVENGPDRRRFWKGRWRTEVDGWLLTLDERPEHREAMAQAHETHLYLLTHVMEIRRIGDEAFDVEMVRRLLDCLRVTLSFAFGRWVAPVLPVGYDADEVVTWEMWTSPICDPAKPIGSPCLYRGRPGDLTELVRCAVPAFHDASKPGFTRFQMCLAIQAVEAGFVEQRILAAAPALEHLTWAGLVLSKRWTSKDYDDRRAGDRLRYVLQLADIPIGIDSSLLPSLARFAQKRGLDGPAAITYVRNRLVHPQTPQDQIYQHDGLVEDTWKLSRNYVMLLLLRSIGYGGEYIDPLKGNGMEGDTNPVPWTAATHSRNPAMPPPKRSIRKPARRGRK